MPRSKVRNPKNTITFRISDPDLADLEEAAKLAGKTPRTLIREILIAWLDWRKTGGSRAA